MGLSKFLTIIDMLSISITVRGLRRACATHALLLLTFLVDIPDYDAVLISGRKKKYWRYTDGHYEYIRIVNPNMVAQVKHLLFLRAEHATRTIAARRL